MHRRHSRGGDKGPWKTDTNEMRKKCPIRRMSKRWDLAPEIRQAIFGDDDVLPDVEKPEPQKPATPIFNVKPEVTAAPSPELEVPTPEKLEWEGLMKSVQEKSVKSKIEMKVVSKALFDFGVLEKDTSDIREFPIDVLRMLNEQWDDIVSRINGGNA